MVNATDPIDKLALKDLYNSNNGQYWLWNTKNGSIWDFSHLNSSDPCLDNWIGISCLYHHTEKLYRVSKIELNFFNLTGTLPASICNLTSLYHLNLAENKIFGTIPSTLVYLKNLSNIEFYKNILTGTIPIFLTEIKKLKFIELSSNCFYGTIPPEIANMSNLEVLFVGGNSLNGSIPNSIFNLTNLRNISFEFNELTGSIPCFYYNLLNINLRYNKLNGTLPSCLGNISSLNSLGLDSNKFTGSIPYEYNKLTRLAIIYLSNNHLTGTIPSFFSNFMNLYQFEIINNHFSGTIPSEFGKLPNLVYFYSSENLLNGSIPYSFGNISSMKYLFIGLNSLTGSIPQSLKNLCDVLFEIELYQNFLTGTIPSYLGECFKLDKIFLFNNKFHGSIPNSFVNLSALKLLLLQDNFLTGTIPNLQYSYNLNSLILNNNKLTGTLPHYLSNLSRLSTVYLETNSLTGTVDPIFSGNKSFLRTVSLSGNLFEGKLDKVFANSQPFNLMVFLDLGNNKFSGTFPSDLFTLASNSLITLSLENNCLTGTIPYEICNATLLRRVFIGGMHANTKCSSTSEMPYFKSYFIRLNPGKIPSCIWDLEYLNEIELSGNGFSGNLEPLSQISLTNSSLKKITLSHNKLTGTIPISLLTNPKITYLDLSFNKFKGHIDSMSYRSSRGLNVSGIILKANRLSGVIPICLRNFTNVDILLSNRFSCSYYSENAPRNDKQFSTYNCGSQTLDNSYIGFGVAFGLILIFCIVFILFSKQSFLKMVANFSKIRSFIANDWRIFPSKPRNPHSLHTIRMSENDGVLSYVGDPNELYREGSTHEIIDPNDISKSNKSFIESENLARCSSKSASAQYFRDMSIMKSLKNSIVLIETPSSTLEGSLKQIEKVDLAANSYQYYKKSVNLVIFIAQFTSLTTVLVCLPIYITLYLWKEDANSNPNISHIDQYSWVTTSVYLTGEVAASILLPIWSFILLVGVLLILYSYQKKALTHELPSENKSRNPVESLNEVSKDSSNTLMFFGKWLSLLHSTRQTRKSFSIMVLLFLINISFILFVNILFVSYQTSLNDLETLWAQVAISAFKITWNLFFIRYFAIFFSDQMWAINALLVMLIFNIVLAPAIASSLFDSNCFAPLIFGTEEVSSQFESKSCILYFPFNPVGMKCLYWLEFSYANSFYPGYNYLFGCTSSLLVTYIPVYIISCIGMLLINPLVNLYLSFMDKKFIPSALFAKLPFFLRPQDMSNNVTVRVSINTQSNHSGISGTLLNAQLFLILNLTLIFTFGFFSPILSILLSITVIVNGRLWLYLIERYIFYSESDDHYERQRITELEEARQKLFTRASFTFTPFHSSTNVDSNQSSHSKEESLFELPSLSHSSSSALESNMKCKSDIESDRVSSFVKKAQGQDPPKGINSDISILSSAEDLLKRQRVIIIRMIEINRICRNIWKIPFKSLYFLCFSCLIIFAFISFDMIGDSKGSTYSLIRTAISLSFSTLIFGIVISYNEQIFF